MVKLEFIENKANGKGKINLNSWHCFEKLPQQRDVLHEERKVR